MIPVYINVRAKEVVFLKMENAELDGLLGVYTQSVRLSNDIMLLIVILLLSFFAWIYRLNSSLFSMKINSINHYMTFQTLLLVSIFMFSAAVKFSYFLNTDLAISFLTLGALLALLSLFYLFKRGLYALFGLMFTETTVEKTIFVHYQTLFCAWGIALYLPVFWILLFDTYLILPIIFLIISFLIFKSILAFKFFNTFVDKNTGFLFFSLYLCAQEIVPLVFLYRGMIYIFDAWQ